MATLVVSIQFYIMDCIKYRKCLLTRCGYLYRISHLYYKGRYLKNARRMILPIYYMGTDVPCVISIISGGNASAAKRRHFVKQIAARLMYRNTSLGFQ